MSTKFALGTLLAFMTVVTAQADAPQPVIIVTQVDFTADTGTFTATAPLCPTGIVRPTDLHGVFNPSGHFLGHWEFVCDDNSGTFITQDHPHFPGRDPAFTLSGPWSVVGKSGTGDYVRLSGHGDWGVVIVFDENGVPLTGEETRVGFVVLN